MLIMKIRVFFVIMGLLIEAADLTNTVYFKEFNYQDTTIKHLSVKNDYSQVNLDSFVADAAPVNHCSSHGEGSSNHTEGLSSQQSPCTSEENYTHLLISITIIIDA